MTKGTAYFADSTATGFRWDFSFDGVPDAIARRALRAKGYDRNAGTSTACNVIPVARILARAGVEIVVSDRGPGAAAILAAI